uniref:Nicastrin n=1 Tax=Phlebotomus papatasi TaxID=29031 RepID=A0A1B0D3C2_PHLPP
MGVFVHISCLLISLLCIANAQRITDKMFSNIVGTSCFRRLNATHSTGCSSTFRGSQGVIHVVKTQEDFEFLFNNPPSPPYAPNVVGLRLFIIFERLMQTWELTAADMKALISILHRDL